MNKTYNPMVDLPNGLGPHLTSPTVAVAEAPGDVCPPRFNLVIGITLVSVSIP